MKSKTFTITALSRTSPAATPSEVPLSKFPRPSRLAIRKLFLALILAGLASALPAQVVTSVFVSPEGPLAAGAPASLWLYCMNNLSNEDRQFFDLSINAQLTSEHETNDVVLNLNTNRSPSLAAIAPGGFVREEYILDIPPGIQGPVSLSISNYNQLNFLVTGNPSSPQTISNLSSAQPATPPAIETPAPAAPATVAMATAPAKPTGTNAAMTPAIETFLNNHLFPYEPIYFILGSYPAAEFQISLKFRLLDLANRSNPLGDLYFAYTQTSYWDLLTADPSFYDTSYKPSLFYSHADVLHGRMLGMPVQLDLQLGAEHESNGRGGTGERSLYTAYLQPALSFGKLEKVQLTFQPRAMYYLDLGKNNPDLPDYRGYVDLCAMLTRKGAESWQDFQLAAKVRAGDYGSHPSFQFDLRFNLFQYIHFAPTIDVQYFAGYGQTLRQYNVYSHGIRAGLCLYF